MRIKKGLVVFCLVAPLAVSLTGCGKKNMLESMSSGSASEEAKVEEALTALDSGDYSKAINELSKLAPSDERNKYLAGAYIGSAGFNTLDLISEIDDLKSAGSTSSTQLWNSVSNIFDTTGTGSLTVTDTNKKIDDLENALSVLVTGTPGGYDTAAPAEFANLSEARLFQAGTAAALHSTLVVSAALSNDPNNIPIDPKQFNVPSDNNFFNTDPEGQQALAAINKDVNILYDAVTEVVGGTEGSGSLVDKMDEFIEAITGAPPVPGQPMQPITSAQLVKYLNDLKTSN